jgi:transposase
MVRPIENEKLLILAELKNPAKSYRNIAKYLGVNRTRIEKIVAKRKLGLKFSDTMGRPRRVDPIGEENISSTILSVKNAGIPLTVSEIKIVIEKEVVKSVQKSGLSGDIICSPSNHEANT